jgi:hypothetical protein
MDSILRLAIEHWQAAFPFVLCAAVGFLCLFVARKKRAAAREELDGRIRKREWDHRELVGIGDASLKLFEAMPIELLKTERLLDRAVSINSSSGLARCAPVLH